MRRWSGMTAIPGDDLDDDSTIIVLPGRHATAARRDAAATGGHSPQQRQRGDRDHLGARRPHRLRTGAAGALASTATGVCCRWSSNATPSPRRWRSARCGPACAPSGATCSARHCAGSVPTTRRASTTSPTSSRCWPAWATRSAPCQAPEEETRGVNDRWQLALAERELRSRTNRHWLLNGVTMLDPRQTFIDVTVQLGRDVTLYPGTILQGNTVIGDGCEIGPDTRLVDCVVGLRARSSRTASAATARSATTPTSVRTPTWHRAPQCLLPASTGAFYTAPAD